MARIFGLALSATLLLGVGAATAQAPRSKASPDLRIVAVDVDERKLDWARRFGATHTVDASVVDPVVAIQEVTDGFGADVVIEAVGRPETYRQAFFSRDQAGTLVDLLHGGNFGKMLVKLV